MLAGVFRTPTFVATRAQERKRGERRAIMRSRSFVNTQFRTISFLLTEERVLQAEQSVVLGGCHVAEPAGVVR